jgi:hypothetical protein
MVSTLEIHPRLSIPLAGDEIAEAVPAGTAFGMMRAVAGAIAERGVE